MLTAVSEEVAGADGHGRPAADAQKPTWPCRSPAIWDPTRRRLDGIVGWASRDADAGRIERSTHVRHALTQRIDATGRQREAAVVAMTLAWRKAWTQHARFWV